MTDLTLSKANPIAPPAPQVQDGRHREVRNWEAVVTRKTRSLLFGLVGGALVATMAGAYGRVDGLSDRLAAASVRYDTEIERIRLRLDRIAIIEQRVLELRDALIAKAKSDAARQEVDDLCDKVLSARVLASSEWTREFSSSSSAGRAAFDKCSENRDEARQRHFDYTNAFQAWRTEADTYMPILGRVAGWKPLSGD